MDPCAHPAISREPHFNSVEPDAPTALERYRSISVTKKASVAIAFSRSDRGPATGASRCRCAPLRTNEVASCTRRARCLSVSRQSASFAVYRGRPGQVQCGDSLQTTHLWRRCLTTRSHRTPSWPFESDESDIGAIRLMRSSSHRPAALLFERPALGRSRLRRDRRQPTIRITSSSDLAGSTAPPTGARAVVDAQFARRRRPTGVTSPATRSTRAIDGPQRT